MKTTDLIPILLYHLKDGDKYGLELINACSECSDGQITVKQPTLYSVLKKLEKSKFITSYWQDSDIGGKRHYFKITENGLMQLETYPPLEDLVKMAISNDEVVDVVVEKELEQKNDKSVSPSPFDNFSIEKPVSTENKKENVFDKLFVDKDNYVNNEISEDKISIVENEVVTQTEENYEVEEPFEEISPSETEEDIIQEEMQDNSENLQDIVLETDVSMQNTEDTVEETVEKTTEDIKPVEENTTKHTASFSVFDALDFGDSEEDDNDQIEEVSSPTEETFELKNPFFKSGQEKSLEEKTNLEINEENSKLLTKDVKSEDFANNANVSTFTQKNIKPVDTSKNIANMFNQELKSPTTPIKYDTNDDIKYQDYIDIKNDKNVRKAIKTANRRLYKVITSGLLSLITILVCFFTVLKSGFTAIFAVFSITSTLYVLYYTCNFIGKFKDHHYSLGENFSYPFKKKFLMRITLFLIFVGATFIINLVLKNKLFEFSNFGNFLAPIIISALLLVDYLLSLIFYKKI